MGFLRKAVSTRPGFLNADCNRAVFLCGTTDPYQTIRNPDSGLQKELQEQAAYVSRSALMEIPEHSTLAVRILTRSPLVPHPPGRSASLQSRDKPGKVAEPR